MAKMINPMAGPNNPTGRDYEGYGGEYPDPKWPGGALLAVNFVLNYEEGAEADFATDGQTSRTLIEDKMGFKGRDMAAESMFEFGSRVGFWRILTLFERNKVPLTLYAAARAFENKGDTVEALRRGIANKMIDICGHGLRWHPHQGRMFNPETEEGRERERAAIKEAAASFAKTVGTKPGEMGWYTAWAPSPHTRELLAEEGWLCDSDSYNDELPYWVKLPRSGKPWLVVPYGLAQNDYKFINPTAQMVTGEGYFTMMKEAVDQMLDEARYQARVKAGLEGGSVVAGNFGVPKMLSIAMHNRVLGHAMRANGLRLLLEYLNELRDKGEVWLCRRTDIARHWMATHPAPSKL